MTTLEELPLRDDLRGLAPYGAPQDADVPVVLNVNENPYPVPEPVQASILSALGAQLAGLNRYPDREFTKLRECLAEYLGHGLTAANIWAANGSNEVLQQLLQAFAGAGRTVMSFAPTYSMYPLLAQGVGSRWVTAPRGEHFELDADAVRAAITSEHPDVVLLCTPNNPTGTYLNNEVIAAAYDASDGILIVDEAYAEFRNPDLPTALELLPDRPRLVVSRTMSKAFAFAGVRLGYFAADPAIADAVRLVRLPYHLSALTQAAATAALAHRNLMLAEVAEIRAQRERIAHEVARLGYRVYPSESNFVLFGGVADPEGVFTGLRERGILIRNTGPGDCLRVNAGTEAETTAFLNALDELTAASPAATSTAAPAVTPPEAPAAAPEGTLA